VGGEPRAGHEGGRYPSPRELALRIAGALACRALRGAIVEDPPFKGDPRHELRAAAFTAAVLARAPGARLPCGASGGDAARRILDSLEAAAEDGLWAGSPAASNFIAAYALEASLALSRKPRAPVEAARRLASTVHVPNQEAIAVYLYALAASAGHEWAYRVARAKLEALSRLASRGSLYEPWGDTPVYNAVAAWALYNAWRAQPRLASARRLASRIAEEILSGLAAWRGPPLLHGRSGMFSFAPATLAAALSLHAAQGGGEWAAEAAARAYSYYVNAYHDGGSRLLPRKNLPDETIVEAYGVREVYAAWAARALLDVALAAEPGDAGEARASTSREHASAWSSGSAGGASLRGYKFFGNYSPPCTPALALARGEPSILPPVGAESSADRLAPARGPAGPIVPRLVWADARLLEGNVVECRAVGVAGGGRLWARRLLLAPGWASMHDALWPPAPVRPRIFVLDPGLVDADPKPVEAGLVNTQSGPLTILEFPAPHARVSWDGEPAPAPAPSIGWLLAWARGLASDLLVYRSYTRRGRVKV